MRNIDFQLGKIRSSLTTVLKRWFQIVAHRTGLADISIRWKLVGTVLVLATLVAATGLVGFNAMSRVGATNEKVYKEQTIANAASDLRLAVEKERSALQAYLRGDASAKERYLTAKKEFNEIHKRLLSKQTLTADQRKTLKQIKTKHQRTTEFAQAAMKARDNENWATMSGELSSYRRNQQRLLTLTEKFRLAAEQDMQQSLAAAESIQKQSRQLLIGLTVLAFLLALVIGLIMARRVTGPVKRLSKVAEQISQGELETEVTDVQRTDEIGELTDSFCDMQEYLNTVADQATAISEQRFDAPVLEEDVPGDFGKTIDRLSNDVEQAQREVETLNQALEAKATDYSATMEEAAKGDLTVRMDPDSQSEAMTQIAEAFNRMLDEFEATLVEINEFAADVASNSEEVSESAGEIETASQQVSESVQEISEGADEQYEQLQDTSNEMQSLSGTIEEVASSANQVAAVSEQAAERAERGAKNASQALEEMNMIEAETGDTVAEVESLAEEIDQISEIVDLITDITEQTNQLALNASIEAARAGEAGEGFAVVADEVKELAQEASDATTEIKELISEIRASTENAVEDIQSMGNSVSTGLETVEDALEALNEMAGDIEEVNQGVQEIDAVTDQQASSTEEVVTMIEDIETISEETSNEAENVSAAAQEQASSLSEVTRSVEDLNERAMELQDLLREFELSVGSGTGRRHSVIGPGATARGQESAAPDGGHLTEN